MESELVEKGEEIYQRRKEEWERLYLNKIIAIEVEKGELAGAGDELNEVYKKAIRNYPKSHFYFRRVGPCAAPDYLFL
jgi:hypothetical protein